MGGFPHWVRIRRQTGSEENRDTGVISPVYLDLYEGPADVQDEGAVLSRRVETSEEVREADGTIFLPESTGNVAAMKPEDVVDVFWSPRAPDPGAGEDWEADAEVVKAVRLDSKLVVRGL